jgi:hypothetical protein
MTPIWKEMARTIMTALEKIRTGWAEVRRL